MTCRAALHERTPDSVAPEDAGRFREWVKGRPGFAGGYHAGDSGTGRMLSVTLWGSAGRLAEVRDRTPPGVPMGIRTERLEIFDLVEELQGRSSVRPDAPRGSSGGASALPRRVLP